MTGLIEGKVAVVTGACSGIGLATAELFLAHGAKVVLADIQDDLGAQITAGLGPNARYQHCNVASASDLSDSVAAAVSAFGRLDIFYNNAGITGDSRSMLDLEGDGFDMTMGVNARAVLLGHKYAAQQFKVQGNGGAILTTASVASYQGGWAPVSYTSSKHAVLGIVRQAAIELSPFGIRSNAISPGVIMTGIQSKAFGVPPEKAGAYAEYLIQQLGPKQAMGRFGFPEDVAKVALFLASDLSAYVNGAVLPVDGGASAITQNTFGAEITAVTGDFLQRD